MKKALLFLALLLPVAAFAQQNINGAVISPNTIPLSAVVQQPAQSIPCVTGSSQGNLAACTQSQIEQLLGGIAAAANANAWSVVSSTRNSNNSVTTASIIWPDGATGTYTATTLSSTCIPSTDAFTATHILNGSTLTATQPAVTRNANCTLSVVPTLTVQ